MADLGYVQGELLDAPRVHWRRSNFAMSVFQPAATGQYPAVSGGSARPVVVRADSWPGVPLRGRYAVDRADACWVPIAIGLTPHGERHTYKTMMDELGTPDQLKDRQMGHSDGSVRAGYSHVTEAMEQRLLDGLTGMWRKALALRHALAEGSPVAVLDRLLRGSAE